MTATKAQAPAAWTKGALRTHLGASFQTFIRLRGDMLACVGPGGDRERLAAVLSEIAVALRAESDWLGSLQPVPPDMRVRPRARFLAEYAESVVRCAQTLTKAATPPFVPENFDPFGVTLLQLVALRERVPELAR